MAERNRIEVACTHCGKILERTPYKIDHQKHHFCDHDCYMAWGCTNLKGDAHPMYRRIMVPCRQCGTEFSVEPSHTKFNRGLFCSKKCRYEGFSGSKHPRWKEGFRPHYYGPNWRQQRRAARKRDCYMCQHCGAKESKLPRKLDVHHIQPFREFGAERYREANHLMNLISLCASCHAFAENGNIPLQPKLL